MPIETVVYRRTQLYAEVWAEPAEVVAKRYGVSGVALAKTCRKLGVPLPGRGYWAQRRAGQRLTRPPLPPANKGQSEELSVSRWHRPERPKQVLSKETEALLAKEETVDAAIIVPSALEQPHRLVLMSAKPLQRAKPIAGIVQVGDHRCLDISVSHSSVDRALRIMDALLKAFEVRDLRVEVTPLRTEERHLYYQRRESETPSNATRVEVSGEWLQFSLTEKIAHKRPPPPPAPKHMRGVEADIWQRWRRPPVEYVPTGNLTLSILNLRHLSVRTCWRDGKQRRVEGCLNDFVSSLYVVAEAIKAERLEQERSWRRREEEARREREDEQRAAEDARRAQELRQVIHDWRFARDVRAYVAEARAFVVEAGLKMAEDAPFGRWLQFASAYAEKVDPLAGLRDNIARVIAQRVASSQGGESPETKSPCADPDER